LEANTDFFARSMVTKISQASLESVKVVLERAVSAQVQGPSTATGIGPSKPQPIVARPRPPPTIPAFRPATASTIKQLLTERAKAVAATEAIGAEQISKSGPSDAGGAVTKIAGATIVEGKCAVNRTSNSDVERSAAFVWWRGPSPRQRRIAAPSPRGSKRARVRWLECGFRYVSATLPKPQRQRSKRARCNN
jgi:hypothetical protein